MRLILGRFQGGIWEWQYDMNNAPAREDPQGLCPGRLGFGAPPFRADRSGARTIVKDKRQRQAVTFEQLSYSNMLTLNALVDLLTEKGSANQTRDIGAHQETSD
jgi:hypothetical protein